MVAKYVERLVASSRPPLDSGDESSRSDEQPFEGWLVEEEHAPVSR